MPVVMAKPDALGGPTALVTRGQAQGLLLGLARHVDRSIILPPDIAETANRAIRQVRERADSEPSFAGELRHQSHCAARLLELADVFNGETIPTWEVLTISLSGLGFRASRHVTHTVTAGDVDAIYGDTTAEKYRHLRPLLVDYLAGHTVRVSWLTGDQHPAALQHWKTYVRHHLLQRPPGGGHLLRNLVHVCEGPDADYLTRSLQ